MASVAVVAVVDERGWLLLQERDEHAPVNPDLWSLVGGGVESGESPSAAARRELREETGVDTDRLTALGTWTLPCELHGEDVVDLFTARLPLTDADIECHEGRQIVFVDPGSVETLDLTEMSRALLPAVLQAYSS